MGELEIWHYVSIGIAFLFGVIIGFVVKIVLDAKIEQGEAKRELQKVCSHRNSCFTDTHPDFPWTCNLCDVVHDGEGNRL